MPSKSAKQKKFMRIAAHDPEFAEKAGIDPKIAEEFYEADKALEEEKAEKKKKAHTTSNENYRDW